MIAGFTPDTDIMAPIYLTLVIIIALTLWAARKYGRINHPATYVAVGVNLALFFVACRQIGIGTGIFEVVA